MATYSARINWATNTVLSQKPTNWVDSVNQVAPGRKDIGISGLGLTIPPLVFVTCEQDPIHIGYVANATNPGDAGWSTSNISIEARDLTTEALDNGVNMTFSIVLETLE